MTKSEYVEWLVKIEKIGLRVCNTARRGRSAVQKLSDSDMDVIAGSGIQLGDLEAIDKMADGFENLAVQLELFAKVKTLKE